MSDEKPKHPGGRPTNYKPEFCEMVINEMKEGAAIEELPLVLNAVVSTIYEWKEKHPEFAEALKKGQAYSQAWWMNKGRAHIENKDFNSGLWFMNMKNRHRWADKTETKNESTVSIPELARLDELKKSYQKDK